MSDHRGAGDRADGISTSRRFVLVVAIFGLLYAILAALGPYGIVPVPVWPEVTQQLLQARAWLGEDLFVDDGDRLELIPVSPRLDVTPYVAHRMVRDPREETIVANIACAVRTGPERGDLMPLQEAHALGLVSEEVLSERVECHVGFPPGPAALLLPMRAVFGGLIPVQLLAALLGGLAVACMDRLFSMALAGDDAGEVSGPAKGTARMELTLLAGIGTLWIWSAPQASTWSFAQTVATTALAAAVLLAATGRAWAAGAALALAVASRPPMVLAVPLLVLLALRWARRQPAAPGPARVVAGVSVRLLAAPAAAIAAMALLNWLRFGSVADFGYRHMLTPPILLERLLVHGQLSPAFLPENLRTLFVEPPRLLDSFPFLVSDPWGMGLLFVTPAILVAVLGLVRSAGAGSRWLRLTAWLSVAAITAPATLYFNTGWVQWGGRFLLDSWPIWLLLVAWGWQGVPIWLRRALLALSVVSNLWGALLTTFGVWPDCCL